MRESFESTLPEWVGDTLRAPVESDAASRSRIMDAVRGLPTPRACSAPMRPSRWMRRGLLSPLGGAVTTLFMTVAVVLRLGSGAGGASGIETVTRVLGDSVVPRALSIAADSAANSTGIAAADGSARWLDTLHIVEFVIRGSSVHAASVIGSFNHWQRGATRLESTGNGEWKARALVPRDALDIAFLVNDAQLIPANTGAPASTRSQYSPLHTDSI